MKKSIILFLGMLLFSVAKEKPISQYTLAFTDCMEHRSNPNACIEEELKHQDKKLNTAYREAKKSIQPFRLKSLRDIQKAWIKYRDKKCSFFHHKESGLGGVTDALQCELDMTIKRARELKKIF